MGLRGQSTTIAAPGTVISVNGRAGAVVLTPADVGITGGAATRIPVFSSASAIAGHAGFTFDSATGIQVVPEVHLGATPFVFKDLGGVLQEGDPNHTWIAATASDVIGSITKAGEVQIWAGASTPGAPTPATITLDVSGRFGTTDSVLALGAPESSAAGQNATEGLALYNSNTAAGDAWDALLLASDVAAGFVGMSYIKGAGIASPATYIQVDGSQTSTGVALSAALSGIFVGDVAGNANQSVSPFSITVGPIDNASDLGGTTATLGFNSRWRSVYAATSVVSPLITATTGNFSGTVTAAAFVTASLQAAFVASPYGAAAGNTGEMRFLELAANGTDYVALKAPDALAAPLTYTLPAVDHTGPWMSNGSGLLSVASGQDLTIVVPVANKTLTFTKGVLTGVV